jgi:hypothetical protein
MTERHGFGDEGQRPSGRGAVTERVARQAHGAREIDLTDEATTREDGSDPVEERDHDQSERESSGAFEPAPPAEATRSGPSSIFDVEERAKQEDLNRTGYEPPVADTEGDAEPSEEPRDEAAEITPTPVPAADPPAGETGPPGLPEPATAAAAEAPADAAPAAETPTAEAAPAADAGTSASLLGSLDVAATRNRLLDIQAGFVDEPRQAVEEAGRFVDDLVRQVADALQAQRGQLAGAEGSTEDLRLALRAYRQFVDRLLGLAN